MTVDFFGININIPEYFHREYKNDIENNKTDKNKPELAFRIINTTLPFIGLYKPLNYPLSVGLSAYRSIISLIELKACFQTDDEEKVSPSDKENVDSSDKKNIPFQFISTTISVTAFAATIIAPPLGMLATNILDLVSEIRKLEGHLHAGRHQQAIESCMNIVNNALYLSLFCIGGAELTIASLAVQIMIGIYHGQVELRKDNYIEATGHFLMAFFRCKQMTAQVKILQSKWKVQEEFNNVIRNQKHEIEKNKKEIEEIKWQQTEEIQKQKKIIAEIEGKIKELREERVKESENRNITIQDLENKLSKQQGWQNILIQYGNNQEGLTTLHSAIRNGDLQAVNLLLENGADVNSRCLGFTALFQAVSTSQLNIARELIKKGADLNSTTFGPITVPAINCAVFRNNIDMINLLIDNGAIINPQGGQMSPLDIAASHGKFEVVKVLVNRGANVQGIILDRAADNLKYSDNSQNLDLIKFLVDKGAIRTNKNDVQCPVINGYLKSVNR